MYNHKNRLVMKWNLYNPDNGHYTKSVICDIQPENSTNIEILMPVEFAKFDGVEWIDRRTPEELNNQKVQSYLANIQTLYTSMFISSLSRVTGKKGSKEELEAVREEYLDKYNVSKEYVHQSLITNQALIDEMNDECERDFPGVALEQTIAYLNATFAAGIDLSNDRLHNFCGLVIFKYESGEVLWKRLKAFCSYFRTACITDVEQSQFAKCDQRIALALQITNDTTIEGIESLVTQSKAL